MKNFIKKHFLLFMVALVFATSTAAIGASANTMDIEAASFYAVTAKRCPLRSGCYESSSVKCYIPKGKTVRVYWSTTNSYGNVWHYVSYSGTYGYLYNGNLA